MKSIFSKFIIALALLLGCSQITAEAQQILWNGNVKAATTKPTNRIPAIVSAPDGTLLVFADNRATRDDIGHGEIDIQMRRSVDQGIHWTTPVTMANGTEKCGYSDPAVVVDNGGSGKILMMCAAGNVTYQNSTSNNKLRIFRFTSSNNGDSWDAGTEKTDEVYNLIGTSVTKAFFTSGKITQSRSKKVGSYNRIYSALVTNNGNYVLYSDNFGDSWSVLGGGIAQNGSGTDEAHVIELPNEDILLVSKASSTGKRYVNLFSYSNGQWGTNGQSNNTTATGCNGDIDIVPAFDQQGNPVYVLVQSAPTASSPRKIITYYYKAIENKSSYQLSDFTTGWNKGLVVCSTPSAYSSLCHLGNGVEAIFYEMAEDTSVRSDPNGYNLVYQTNTISEITVGAYVSVPAEDATIVKMAPKGQMVDVTSEVYPFVPTTMSVDQIKGKDVEFMILSSDGKYGFSYQKGFSIDVGNNYVSYTDQPNTDGNLYTFKMDNDGYIYCIGRDQYLNHDTPWNLGSVKLENSKGTKWTLAKDGDNYLLNCNYAGNYYLEIAENSIKTQLRSNKNNAKRVKLLVKSTTPIQVIDQEFAKLDPVNIEIIASEGYGTYYRADDAYMMPNGLTGYFIEDAVKADHLTLETRYDAGSVVPAGTALILYGAAGKYQATLYQEHNDGNELARKWNDAPLNQLEGHRAADGKTTASERGDDVYYYKLSYGPNNDHLDFYWGAEEGGPFEIPNPNTAYLAVLKTQASKLKGLTLPADPNETIAIHSVAIDNVGTSVDAIFNLNGQRIEVADHLPSGIYVRGGKKILIR